MSTSLKRLLRSFVIGALLAVAIGVGVRTIVHAQAPEAAAAPLNDPTGATTGTAKDVAV